MKIFGDIFRILLALIIISILISSPTPAHASGTTITVNGSGDNTLVNLAGNGTCDLREAVEVVNTNFTVDDCTAGAAPYTIAFNITPSGAHEISLVSEIDIDAPVTIDGSTQPGWSSAPIIQIDGGGSVSDGFVFSIGSERSVMKSLMITRFNTQVTINAGNPTDHVTLTGNFIGTDGTNSLGGVLGIGVDIDGGKYAQIGGLLPADRNVISGNTQNFELAGNGDNNVIQGNYVGLDAAGTAVVSGSAGGFLISGSGTDGASNNLITGNVISGNYSYGIWNVTSKNNSNVFQSNYIGTNASGTTALGGASNGIEIDAGSGNQVGGTASGTGNVISGNVTGIYVTGTATGTNIFGNLVGTDKSGTSAISNSSEGIHLNNVSADIGDSVTPGNNVISGNSNGSTSNGIHLTGAGTSGTTIIGNKIGVDSVGSGSLPNDVGVFIESSGSAQISKNWIANNTNYSVLLNNPSTVAGGSTNTNNCFIANGLFGLANVPATVADFTNNWWGSASGPTEPIGNPSGVGDKVSPSSGNIDYSGFLTTPPLACSPAVSLSSGSAAFGNHLVSSSASKTLTLTNIGGKVLTLTSITTTAGPYSLSGTCPLGAGTLGSGSSCTIQVKFSPIALGLAPRNLTFTTDASTSPDNVALTGKGIAGTQLLKNPDFETDANNDNKPDNWAFTGIKTPSDKRDCTVHKTGKCSLKLVGNKNQKVVSQTISKSGGAGNDFTFSLWNRTTGIPAASINRLQVTFYHGGSIISTQTMNFTTGTHTFKKVSGTFTAPGSYTKIVFKIVFKASSGTAWFDTTALNWAP